MLELRHVTKRYPATTAVKDISFVARRGEVTGYLGPNGSGKSTTLKMITGLIDPTEGDPTEHFNFTNFEQLGATTDTLFFELQNNNNLTDVASIVLGRHTLKFGGEARHIRTDNLIRKRSPAAVRDAPANRAERATIFWPAHPGIGACSIGL